MFKLNGRTFRVKVKKANPRKFAVTIKILLENYDRHDAETGK